MNSAFRRGAVAVLVAVSATGCEARVHLESKPADSVEVIQQTARGEAIDFDMHGTRCIALEYNTNIGLQCDFAGDTLP